MHYTTRSALGLALLTTFVSAQTPPFIGALLLEPGLSNAKCMTAASNNDGAFVTIQGCTGATSQKWTFSGGSVKVFGNKCLDVTDGITTDGTKLQIWTCSANNPNQNFSYTGDNRLAWTNKGKCVDLSGGRLDDGNRIQSWACRDNNANQVWNTGYNVNQLPQTSQNGQFGTNACGTTSSQTANCQTAWINSADDFCLWAPPNPNSAIGDIEREAIAWCTKSGRGSRTIPDGTLKGVHFVKTQNYVQITGVGDFTKVNVRAGDAGGELDNRGADGKGNPVGGLVYGNTFGAGQQYHEWTTFISDSEFCIRACIGPDATKNCNHIYDVMGCYWNMPANYDAGVFENCDADNDLPMGVYGTSTWHQGVSPTPPPHPAASSSNCQALPTVKVTPAQVKRNGGFEKVVLPRFPGATPAPLA
ncbi:carbohydrate-binding module family 13 protein [Collybia nuda]|uniref:Carbohydrate-binding module family 13 protein n=1 Tax=Collybia nuda TaxID=64659 RepID=A0A9P6CB20_9AGAR|nr:carbohydrate-binding module family 13 protein [Collybia nuda]